MATRIRYSKTEAGNLISTKPILTGQHNVSVTIDPVEFTFSVTSLASGEVLTGGQANGLNQVKALAKEALKALGANFADEVRASKRVLDLAS